MSIQRIREAAAQNQAIYADLCAEISNRLTALHPVPLALVREALYQASVATGDLPASVAGSVHEFLAVLVAHATSPLPAPAPMPTPMPAPAPAQSTPNQEGGAPWVWD